ncbi:MAG: hypothetical protein JO257_07170 [Deltaproteobacteria bacterium]|nr:hypothetical protein [Deltaproteobacteria bacterium]
MIRTTLLATVALAACGRSQGVEDRDLGGLVVAPKQEDTRIALDRAVKDPAELTRALSLTKRQVDAVLGLHTVAVSTQTIVEEAGKPVSDLSDHTTIELGEAGSFHAVYTNSADYGREVIYVSGQLYLKPRYQRWHQRAPEGPDEPAQIEDDMYGAIAATWDLFAPGAELTDQGAAQVGGRPGRKIAVKLSPSPKKPPAEKLAQRKWREKRTIDALEGVVILDADKGVPLAVQLVGTVGFTRDNRRFAMKITLTSDVSGIGVAATVKSPAPEDTVATPERLREVDERDFLLQGIAPPLRKNPDGSPVTPAPAAPAATGSGSNSKK